MERREIDTVKYENLIDIILSRSEIAHVAFGRR